jgi:protein SCO1/2
LLKRSFIVNGLGIALLIIALAIIYIASFLRQEPAGFQGNQLTPSRLSPSFELTNQNGSKVRWSDYRGEYIVLTFLYTNCHELCPVIAHKLQQTHSVIKEQTAKVRFVAISLDPDRDTPDSINEFMETWGLDSWDYLVGAEELLLPLWQHYWVGTLIQQSTGNAPTKDRAYGEYTINHASPVHLIDQRGYAHVAYGSFFESSELTNDILYLIKIQES